MSDVMARAAMPMLRKRSTWSFMSAISGETTKHNLPMTRAGTWKHRLLPPPVGISAKVSLPARISRITLSCIGRNAV